MKKGSLEQVRDLNYVPLLPADWRRLMFVSKVPRGGDAPFVQFSAVWKNQQTERRNSVRSTLRAQRTQQQEGHFSECGKLSVIFFFSFFPSVSIDLPKTVHSSAISSKCKKTNKQKQKQCLLHYGRVTLSLGLSKYCLFSDGSKFMRLVTRQGLFNGVFRLILG